MYQIGELIIYENYGACKVEAIGTPDMGGIDKDRLYYTLCPAFQGGKIFIPIDTNAFMRPVITKDEALKIISHIPSITVDEFDKRDQKSQEQYYKELIKSHECIDLIKIIKTIYTKISQRAGKGAALGRTDERFMKKAEDLLYGEFAIALEIPVNSVKSYIEDQVGKLENQSEISS